MAVQNDPQPEKKLGYRTPVAEAKICPGMFLVWERDTSCLILYPPTGMTTAMSWRGGDNKNLITCISTEQDFYHIAALVAETHGLCVSPPKYTKGNPPLLYFEFWDPSSDENPTT